MRRTARTRAAAAAAVVATLVMAGAGPAVAQVYPEPPTTTTSSSTTSTTAVEEVPAGERVADVSTDTANPGDPVSMSSGGVFDPGSTVDVVLVRGQQGETGVEVSTDVTVNPDGSIDVTFTVPADTPPGVYFVYAEGLDPDGNPIRVTGVIVVLAEGQTAAAAAPAAEGAAAPAKAGSAAAPGAVVPPAEIQRLQVSAEAEQALVDEVTADRGARVVIDGDRLSVSSDDGSSAAPITAGVAAGGLVLAGAIALRARRSRA